MGEKIILRVIVAGCRNYNNYEEAKKYGKPIRIKNMTEANLAVSITDKDEDALNKKLYYSSVSCIIKGLEK